MDAWAVSLGVVSAAQKRGCAWCGRVELAVHLEPEKGVARESVDGVWGLRGGAWGQGLYRRGRRMESSCEELSGIGLGVTRSEEVCVLSWEILSGDWEVVFGVKGLKICLELPGL